MVTYIVNDRLLWKGISWVWCQGPRVDRSNAWVDDNGDLNLRMQKFDGIYKGVLFETPTPYLYGRIRWTASSPTLNIERNASLGLCTYYDDPNTSIPNELDIEINQWPGYDERIWFSCHPASIDSHPENIHYGCLSTDPNVNDSGCVYTIEWTPTYVYYSVVASDGTTILEWNYTGDDIPHTSAYICMFFGVLAQGAGPASGNPITIKFSNFEYDSMRIAANFSAPVRSGTTNTTFSFSDTSTGLPRTWLWNFGDGTTSTEQNPTHRYTTPGTYTVTLTATNAVSNDVETKSSYITVTAASGVIAPVAAFSGTPRSGTAPLTVQFTDASTNTPTSWSWNFGDGTTSTVQNPSHTYSAAGNYTVTLTATNSAGSDGETKTDYITASAAAPTLTILENVIRNSNFESWSAGTTGVAPDAWSISTDTTTIGGNFRSTGGAAGTYCLGITGDGVQRYRGHILTFTGVSAAPTKMDAWVKKVGSATGGIEFFCWNGAGNYKSVSAGAISSDTWVHFEWDLTARPATGSIEADIYTNQTANGNWLVDCFQVSNVISIFSNTETVNASYVQKSFTYSPSNVYTVSNICVNFSTYPLTDYDISTVTATIDGVSKTVWFRGNYVYIDSSGLSTSPHTVAIQANRSVSGIAPVANFTADKTSGTEPLTVTFTDTSTNTPTSWSWNFGDGGTSTARNPVHIYYAPGTYTVTLTATNAAGSDEETKTGYITVSAAASAPTADFSADTTSGTAPLEVIFTDTSTGSPTSWLWDFGDGNTSTDQNPSHTYALSGTYTVTLTATNSTGSDEETKTNYITVAAKSVTHWFWYWFSRLWR